MVTEQSHAQVRKAEQEAENPHTAKIRKLDAENVGPRAVPGNSDISGCFSENLFSEENVEKLSNAYATSSPYLHTCISNLMNEELLSDVRKEITTNLVFTEKETDIYKVHQTGDLANIDGLPEQEKNKLSQLHRLRNALYSQKFRDFVAKVTNCGPLSGIEQDMSINSYRRGSHLLNHDDVIGTRRVSYILYLPEPRNWTEDLGGALELYPCVSKGTPDVVPTNVIPPKWNQFVMFTVQPGYSFHSVQEVLAEDRLSISGWFHFPQQGEPGYVEDINKLGSAPASLAQLEDDCKDVEFPFKDHVSCSENDAEVSELELEELAKFLNPKYLTPESWTNVNEEFYSASNVKLVDFLQPTYAQALKLSLLDADQRDGLAEGKSSLAHTAGCQPGWKIEGSPVKQRFMVLSGPSSGEIVPPEVTILRELESFLQSKAFSRWLYQLSGAIAQSFRGRARRFRAGLDYTLATSSTQASFLDVTLCLTPGHPSWSDGEVGRYECYVSPDEENDDPAVYRAASEDGALLTTTADWNVLTLVLRDRGVMRFVKYVSALAQGSRWDIANEYMLCDGEE
jgi:Rps23 Pro-64 3,4-dihydroxylase Tpa1-like proline 4-hydroxylase